VIGGDLIIAVGLGCGVFRALVLQPATEK
jgi:hypothetical protein